MPKTIDPKFHGTYTGYVYGCRCSECRNANSLSHKRNELQRLQGLRRMPIQFARDAIDAYFELGYTPRDIAIATGLKPATIDSLRFKTNRKYVNYETYHALLNPAEVGPSIVPSDWCKRIEHSLMAIGWTQTHIVEAMGRKTTDSRSRGGWNSREFVSRETAIALLDAFERLSLKAGPSEITKRRALERGYLDPFLIEDELYEDQITKALLLYMDLEKNVA